MDALLNPASRTKEGFKWGLVVHTAAMFLFVTVFTAMSLDLPSISYVGNREFPGNDALPKGPFGYQSLMYSEPITVIPYVMFFSNNLLADGLLVSSISSPAVLASNTNNSSSSIVVMSFIQ
jgi:hypothetical protein